MKTQPVKSQHVVGLESPKYVGAYKIAEIYYMMLQRPKWIHRKMMNICLGITWHEVDDKMQVIK